MPPIDLNPHDLKIVLAILRKFVPDREVWAFGSRVKWTAKPFSDLDLAIVGEQSLPISIAADLAEAFDESELPIKVDVVDWATTSEAFRQIIKKEKVLLQQTSKGSAVSPAPTFGNEEWPVLAKGWRPGVLADCVLLQSGGTPSKSRHDFWGGSVPWVSAKDMKSYWIESSEDQLTPAGVMAASRVV